MFILLVALGLLVGLLAFGFADDQVRRNERQQKTADAQARAKDALIGWSVQRTSSAALPNARPGELPCPDINPVDGFDDGNCAAGAIGRVPWKTLGIPEPTDDAGETLWYAIAGPFRIWNVNANPINSDTRGNLTVYFDSTATTITTAAVAVIFAPGAALGGQIRDATLALCPTTGTTIARNLCAANYLEATGGANNATIGGPYVSAQRSDIFNDRLLVITTPDLIPMVEQRVAREMLALLERYRTAPANWCANDCYTWPDEDFTNEGDNDAFRGWLPLGEGDPHDWWELSITIPTWLTNNDWWKVVYYAVAPDKTQNDSGGTLTVDGVAGTLAVLITPGPAGTNRPVNPPGTAAYWAEYLNDAENADHNDNNYVRPSLNVYAGDRIYVLP
ncbi:MAG: hypothetical protein ACT4PQ_07940 [Betaproteobacteria bacterium]